MCQLSYLEAAIPWRRTIDVDQASAMADQTLRGPEQVVEADTETDLLDDLVRIFRIDIVLDCHNAALPKVIGRDLDKVRDFRLGSRMSVVSMGGPRGAGKGGRTRMNMVSKRSEHLWYEEKKRP